ncbi:LacI family DNA-binding transcriptional regulator [Arthrobacter monumenti]
MGIREVAESANVSVTTASRALNGTGRIASATRAKVRQVANELGYQPNEVARQLKEGTSSTVGVLVPDITNPFFPELVRGIQEVADKHGHVLLLAPTNGEPAGTAKALRQMRSRHVAGIVIVDDCLDDNALVQELGGLRFVALDRKLNTPDCTWVASDHLAGGRLATEHLIALGHERIVHVAGEQRVGVARDRLDGYRQALAAADLPVDDDLVVAADFTEDAGYQAVLRLLNRDVHFTAIFAVDDLAAIGAMRALDEHRLHVPDDVSVVGFDDIHLASYVRPGLTTVRQQITELGRVAAELLLDDDAGTNGRSRTLPVSVVTRGTTARAAQRPGRQL